MIVVRLLDVCIISEHRPGRALKRIELEQEPGSDKGKKPKKAKKTKDPKHGDLYQVHGVGELRHAGELLRVDDATGAQLVEYGIAEQVIYGLSQ